MRWMLILMLVGCAADDDECGDTGDAKTFDVHTRLVGQFLDPPDANASSVQVQDGGPACPWRTIENAGVGHYTVAAHHDRFAVAVTCGTDVTVLARSTLDFEPLEVACFANGPASDGFEIKAHSDGAVGNSKYVLQVFVADQPSEKHGFFQVSNFFSWRARGGRYDLVALGHAGDEDLDAPDRLHVVRKIAAADTPDLDVTPADTADWLALGPPVTVELKEGFEALLGYRTSGGTSVGLGGADAFSAPVTAALPTWPAAAAAPGDVYLQALFYDDPSFIYSLEARRESPTPTAFDLQLPFPFQILRDTETSFLFVRNSPADGYVLSCNNGDHVFVTDFTTHWLGDELRYELPQLDGVDYTECRFWDGSVRGHRSATETFRATTHVPN